MLLGMLLLLKQGQKAQWMYICQIRLQKNVPAFREMLISLTFVPAKTVPVIQMATPTFAPKNKQERKPRLLLAVAEKIVLRFVLRFVFTYSLMLENSVTNAIMRH